MIIIFSKIFAVALAVLVLSRSISDFKAKRESLTMALFWAIIWIGISVLALYPNLINNLISLLGGSRTGLGTIFGLAIVFIMFINYRIYLKAHRIEIQIRKVATEIGLKNIDEI